MLKLIAAYGLTTLVFLAIDFVWLGFVAKGFYADRLKGLLLDQPNFAVAGVFYLLFVVGLIIFAVAPALKENSLTTAIVFGALFGFFAYATYDLSNLATLRNWPVEVVIVDIVWGAFIAGVSAGAGFLLTRLLPIA